MVVIVIRELSNVAKVIKKFFLFLGPFSAYAFFAISFFFYRILSVNLVQYSCANVSKNQLLAKAST